jgi:hypothetical protein
MGVPPHFPVKQGYNRTLHTLHATSSLTDSSHTRVDHVARLVEHIQPLQQHVMINTSTRKETHQASDLAEVSPSSMGA